MAVSITTCESKAIGGPKENISTLAYDSRREARGYGARIGTDFDKEKYKRDL